MLTANLSQLLSRWLVDVFRTYTRVYLLCMCTKFIYKMYVLCVQYVYLHDTSLHISTLLDQLFLDLPCTSYCTSPPPPLRTRVNVISLDIYSPRPLWCSSFWLTWISSMLLQHLTSAAKRPFLRRHPHPHCQFPPSYFFARSCSLIGCVDKLKFTWVYEGFRFCRWNDYYWCLTMSILDPCYEPMAFT